MNPVNPNLGDMFIMGYDEVDIYAENVILIPFVEMYLDFLVEEVNHVIGIQNQNKCCRICIN